MKFLIAIFCSLILSTTILKADDINLYTKEEINKIASNFVFNKVDVTNPAVVDVDGDGLFDMLNFAADGNVEFYKNTGTNENPEFILEDPNYGDVKIHKMFKGMPVPVFFADATGDGSLDVFAVMSSKFDASTNTIQHGIAYHENAMGINHYLLITIILVLVIVLLVLAIL